MLFAHVAEYQARLVVRTVFFPFPAKADDSKVPWAIFTDPTLAPVGVKIGGLSRMTHVYPTW